jgi:predicted RNA-binding Zn-ribbon protein involved in translation (DUF1610 family)
MPITRLEQIPPGARFSIVSTDGVMQKCPDCRDSRFIRCGTGGTIAFAPSALFFACEHCGNKYPDLPARCTISFAEKVPAKSEGDPASVTLYGSSMRLAGAMAKIDRLKGVLFKADAALRGVLRDIEELAE